MRSAIKNRVHAILAKHGITREHSDLFGKGGREFLAELELREAPRRRLDSLIVADRDFDREIDRDDQGDRPAREGRRSRRGALPDPRCRALHRDADHRRGRRDHPLPRRPASLRLGRAHADRAQLRRQSPPRAHLPPRITGAALGARRSRQKCTTGGGPLREQFERITKRRGRKVAKVAVARQILTLSYYGLRDGEIRCLARRSRASAKEKLAAAHERRRARYSVGLAPPTAARAERSGELVVCHGLANTGRPPT